MQRWGPTAGLDTFEKASHLPLPENELRLLRCEARGLVALRTELARWLK
jgi:hypothetical protein